MINIRIYRDFFAKDTELVAQRLIGQRIIRILPDGSRISAIITETEAYLGKRDKACHSYGGRKTKRNNSMWLDAGHAYIYLIYGMYDCFNISTVSADEPEAVLIRSVLPEEGSYEIMQKNRQNLSRARSKLDYSYKHRKKLTDGPGKLCQALMINRELDSHDLVTSDILWLEENQEYNITHDDIIKTARIGIDYAEEWRDKKLRYILNVHS